ncbi:LexA family protein [Ruminococcus flavefaciens]|uniref:Repressor LexA n=1 Tax=Ruminococcus flavefaciens TaxID=1265 RepID=A0A315Y4H4_RUMFL|nr:XRE family transcriptional regulator [Ruminococcus flavefaciens]PWJ13919.1 repressor LexA [Ruminococcus flavefaciens]SSA43453.1 repressor LexA [Ruminococcus flavefaciens]
MTIGERIKERRKELGLTVDELAERLGKNRATIYRYESNDIEKLPTTVLEPLAKVLNVTPAYLMGWKTNDTPIKKIPYSEANCVRVPLIGRVAAGYNCHAEENISEYIMTDSDILKDGYQHFWLEVKGDSMEPELHEKDLVLVREQEVLDKECYAVVNVDAEDGLVKLVDIENTRITLSSVNPYYPPRVFEFEEMNRVKVIGPVIEVKRRF